MRCVVAMTCRTNVSKYCVLWMDFCDFYKTNLVVGTHVHHGAFMVQRSCWRRRRTVAVGSCGSGSYRYPWGGRVLSGTMASNGCNRIVLVCSLLVQSMVWVSLGSPDGSSFKNANLVDLTIQCDTCCSGYSNACVRFPIWCKLTHAGAILDKSG